jgi:hypothetical protein
LPDKTATGVPRRNLCFYWILIIDGYVIIRIPGKISRKFSLLAPLETELCVFDESFTAETRRREERETGKEILPRIFADRTDKKTDHFF